MAAGMFRTLVVEDEPRILAHLAQKIGKLDERFRVVGTARNGQDALTLVHELQPDVVFSDVYMPRMDGIALSAQLRQLPNPPKMVIISGFRDFDYAREAMRNGVHDYLLKPVSDEELRDVLENIADQLMRENAVLETETVIRAAKGNLGQGAIPRRMMTVQFWPVLVNLGSLLGPVPNASHERVISHILKGINDETLAHGGIFQESGLWICPALTQAQVLMVFEDRGCQPDFQRLLEELSQYGQGYAVTLCVPSAPCELHLLQAWTLELATMMARRLCPGKSGLFYLGDNTPAAKAVLGCDQLNVFKGHIQTHRFDLAKDELAHLLETWDRNACTQYQVESELRQLIHGLARLRMDIEEGDLYLTEHLSLGALESARTLSEALDEIWTILEDLLLRPTEKSDYSARTVNDIEAFLHAHYAQDLSVEAIAESAGFHAVYLNRLFKKHKQVTLIQYLINLRMEKAKQLMREHPQWDLALIGESVGYNDPHYFSRAFKKNTGLSPSEWRASAE